jgi:hypothetical protein
MSMGFERVQVVTILQSAVGALGKASFFNLVFFQAFHPFPCITCFMLLVMGLSLKLLNFFF